MWSPLLFPCDEGIFTSSRPRSGDSRQKPVITFAPVDGPVNLCTQNTLPVVLCTGGIGRCLCTHVPGRFRGGMAIQRDALSTSTPLPTQARMLQYLERKYHTDGTGQH